MIRGAFSFSGYRHLLEAINCAGYRCVTFKEDTGTDGTVLLRHDVDQSPDAALDIAKIEHEHGVVSTFFFLTRAPLYGILEPATIAVVREISAMGHSIGLHCDERRIAPELGEGATLDEKVDRELSVMESILGSVCSRVVSFHNPSDECLGRTPTTGEYISTYGSEFMLPETKYISESNANWREGAPHERLREGIWARVQILIHPVWWARKDESDPKEVLCRVFEERVSVMDEYLAWSNDLWTPGMWRDSGC